MRSLFRTESDYAVALPRIMLGIVFFVHGAQKVLGWFGGHGFNASLSGMTQMGIPTVFALLAIAAEFLGGIGLIVGLLGRVAAFGIFVEMVVAVVKVHGANGFFMNWAGNQRGEGFEYHLLVLAIAALIMIKGSGALSLDRLIGRPSSSEEKHRLVAA